MKNIRPIKYLPEWSEINSTEQNLARTFITDRPLENMLLNISKEKIRNFLQKIVHTAPLRDNDDIFSLGLVNSMFAMELVLFVEKTFKIKVENSDLHFDNFKSINAIDAFIQQKLHYISAGK